MIDYIWVPWFEKLAARIAEGGEKYLAKNANEVTWLTKNPALLAYGDENIDPFSFLYFLAQKNTINQYEPVFRSVHEVFGIESDFPETAFIPTPTPNTAVLFHYKFRYKQSSRPDLLWRLFRQAAEETPNIERDDFNAALDIPNVGMVKLTQTLFITNPKYFLPVDSAISTALPQLGRHEDVQDYDGYVTRMDAIKELFPGCEPYEIHTILFIQAGKNPLITEETRFFQISTNVYDKGIDYWEWTDGFEAEEPFKENNYVYTGGPGADKIDYPLTEPNPGDIILVRTGRHRGRAIGVVEENGYDPDGWDDVPAIYVHWINKVSANIEDDLPILGFGYAGKGTQKGFRNTKDYRDSFELIDRWTGDGGVEPQFDPEPPAEEPDTLFPLNTILFGPPGTGKTWEAVSYAVAIVDNKNPMELAQAENRGNVKARFKELRGGEQVEFVTFHQNYTYEDFIEGIVPVLDEDDLRYKLRDGVFKRISSRAHEYSNERHVLIIDEINRGNIAKIFGELITLIEPSKRSGGDDAAAVTLPYSQESFSVPGNLYLVGTMNTADRGIALLDTALRRRFDFIEKMPDMRLLAENVAGVNGRLMLKAMNKRITVHLGREHQIGHTYLIGVTTIDGLAEAFQRRIVPLLQEYFYDDWAKIRSVLNENPFIRELKIETTIRDDHSKRPVFELLAQGDDKWKDAESYQQIYVSEQAQGAD